MHLGDVYYSARRRKSRRASSTCGRRRPEGEPLAQLESRDVLRRLRLFRSPAAEAASRRALTSPCRIRHWLLVGLDTAYVDHDMDTQQVSWLNLVIEQRAGTEGRAVLAPATVLAPQQSGPQAAGALRHLARGQADHRVGTSDTNTSASSTTAREMEPPRPLSRQRRDSRAAQQRGDERAHRREEATTGIDGTAWKRLSGTTDVARVHRPRRPEHGHGKTKDQDKFIPHGFMTLEFPATS